MKQLAFEFGAIPPPSLENFITGRNAELLHNVRRLALAHAGERIIYVWGAPGSGRSHLLKGAISAARATGADAVYLACDRDTRLPAELAARVCLAVDDVERLDDRAQVGLFNLCNTMREHEGALFVSGNVPPARLGLRQDLVTRLGWGLVYEVHGLSDDEKAQALRQRAAERGFSLTDEVCSYVMTRAPRDMSTLFSLLDALDRYSLEAKRPVTVALARELLQTVAQRGTKAGNGR